MKMQVWVAALFVCLFIGVLITPQTNNAATPNVTAFAEKVPDHLVYRYFLGHVNHLDKQADVLARQGKNPDELRNYYKKKLALSETEAASLKRIASELETQLGIQDAKAKELIANERKKFPNGKLPSRESLPKVPQEIVKMQHDRDTLIKLKMNQCKGLLSAAANGKIERFLAEEFVKNIKIQSVDIPRGYKSKKPSPSPFPKN